MADRAAVGAPAARGGGALLCSGQWLAGSRWSTALHPFSLYLYRLNSPAACSERGEEQARERERIEKIIRVSGAGGACAVGVKRGLGHATGNG